MSHAWEGAILLFYLLWPFPVAFFLISGMIGGNTQEDEDVQKYKMDDDYQWYVGD